PLTALLMFTTTATMPAPVGPLTVPCTVPAPPRPWAAATGRPSRASHRNVRPVTFSERDSRIYPPTRPLSVQVVRDDGNTRSGLFQPAFVMLKPMSGGGGTTGLS